MGWQREMAWHRLNERGEERCVFACEDAHCIVEGVGAAAMNGSGFVFEYRLDYSADWVPESIVVVAHVGPDEYTRRLARADGDTWLVDGSRAVEYDGCTDADFSFSPSTNITSTRRLALNVGEETTIHAIWVLEPHLELRRAEQTYRRVSEDRYEFRMGEFSAEIEVDSEGMVLNYPGIFEAASLAVGD